VSHKNSHDGDHPVCDYEGSGYKEDFWTGQGREYEDLAERIAIQRLLPHRGNRLLEIGAGFGRLAGLYDGYDEVVLLDYSRSLLGQARAQWGNDPRYTFVAGNLYDLPFSEGYFDAIVIVRVIHHVVDVPLALAQIRRVLAGRGRLILEFANKRHLKAIVRYVLRKQSSSPFNREPLEFVKLNFNFHPIWMQQRLGDAGLRIERQLALSHFRLAPLKRAVRAERLAQVDGLLQPIGAVCNVTPSILVRCRPITIADPATRGRFRCLACSSDGLVRSGEGLTCSVCGTQWPIRDGIYDFKPPAEP
jgi:SAM-dependent methyltransferase